MFDRSKHMGKLCDLEYCMEYANSEFNEEHHELTVGLL